MKLFDVSVERGMYCTGKVRVEAEDADGAEEEVKRRIRKMELREEDVEWGEPQDEDCSFQSTGDVDDVGEAGGAESSTVVFGVEHHPWSGAFLMPARKADAFDGFDDFDDGLVFDWGERWPDGTDVQGLDDLNEGWFWVRVSVV
jgi:hypothetical protein